MTDISVWTQSFQTEDRSWDLTPSDGGFEIGGTIDVASFTQSQHYPNGYIPSGAVLAKSTTGANSGKLIPYLDAGTGGASTAVGILKSSLRIVRQDGTKPTAVGAALMVHGIVNSAKLPFNVTNQAGGGYLDANAQADLKLVAFV